jgi:protease PrsW
MLPIIAAIIPVIIFLVFIYRKDKQKEPFGLLIKCLLGGVLSLVISLGFSLPLSSLRDVVEGAMSKALYDAFMLAAFPEEIGKFVVLYWFVWKSRDFNQRYDGIVYAVFISLGFALVENIMYVIEGGLHVALGRALLSIPGHGFFGVLMGYFFSRAKFVEKTRTRNMIRALLYPVLFHGLFNFFLMWMSNLEGNNPLLIVLLFVAFFAVVVLLWRAGLRAIRIHSFRDFVDGIKY